MNVTNHMAYNALDSLREVIDDNIIENHHEFLIDCIKSAIREAFAVAPASDDYQRGLEDAMKAVREHAEGIERELGSCIRSQNIRDAESVIAALAAVRALGVSK